MRSNVFALFLSLLPCACSATSDLGGDLFGDAGNPTDTDGGGGLRGLFPNGDGGTGADGSPVVGTVANGSDPDPGSSTPGTNAGTDDAGPTHPTAKRVFVTATAYNGDLRTAAGATTGLAAGDQLCKNAAVAANLGGNWVAWLSDSKTNAVDRVADASPWYLVDRKTLAFPTKAALAASPLHGVSQNERGEYGSSLIWTGTATGGHTSGPACADWTAPTGEATVGQGDVATWTSWAASWDCGDSAAIYCFEQP